MLQRLILLWLLLSSGLAWYWPNLSAGFDPFLAGGKSAIDLLIVTAMFSVGALLPLDEVNRLVRSWRTILCGTATQYVTMPAAAWCIVSLFGLEGEIATGVMIVGCVPGAMASNVLTMVARGNVSFSVSLTTSATLLSPLIVPVVLQLTLGTEVQYDGTKAVSTLLLQIVLPVVAGHVCSRRSVRFRSAAAAIAPVAANVSILIIIAIAVALRRDVLAAGMNQLLLPLLLLNMTGYLAGYSVGRFRRWEVGYRRALTLEVGMQNAGAGVALAAALFGADSTALVPCVLYTFGCMLTGTVLATCWNLSAASDSPEASGNCEPEIRESSTGNANDRSGGSGPDVDLSTL